MSRLSYGSFEEILHPYIKPEIIKLDLANILFTAPVDQELKEASEVDSPTVTRVCTGQRPLPPRLRAYYAKPDALERIVAVFSNDIVSRIQEIDKAALVREILTLILDDEAIPQEAKAAFEASSKNESLSTFLAKVYLYAVTRKDPPEKITNLPRQNQFFCGREDLLAAISTRYAEGTHMQGLYGMGGVGKTQLALQYAYTHFDEYEMIWWINAENKATLQSSIAKFLSELRRLPRGKNDDDVRKIFLRYLNKHDDWLLIYDNAEYGTAEEYEALLSYVPQRSQGHILLTTRCANAFEGAVHRELQVFSGAEAANFLQRRSCLNDGLNAARVAEQLGFLPLALEYAAAYIRETPGVDYVAYSKRLEQRGIKVLDRPVGCQAYKNTVRQAFHISLDRISEDADTNPVSQGAEQFLSICAFLAPDDIEIDIFVNYGRALPEPIRTVLQDELDRDELLRNLTRYSLVQIDTGAMSMHRLLQEVLRDELAPEAKILCVNYAYGVFYSVFYSLRKKNFTNMRPILLPLVPHIQTVLNRYVQLHWQEGQELPDSIMVAKEYFSWSAFLLSDTKNLAGEELLSAVTRNTSVLRTAVGFYDMMPGPKTIYLPYTLMLLAQSYEKLGEELEAVAAYIRALPVLREVVDGLSAVPRPQPGSVQALYQSEAFQLACDICAAVGSSSIVYRHTELLWANLKSLIGIVEAKMLLFPRKEEAENYTEAALFLRIFCGQIADCTSHAFILRLHTPVRWREERGQSLLDGPFGFFLPSKDIGYTPPRDITKGFDILLDGKNEDGLAVKLSTSWITLAFPKDIRTEDEMLEALMAVSTKGLDEAAHRSLYSAIRVLAGHLGREDIVVQCQNRLGAFPR